MPAATRLQRSTAKRQGHEVTGGVDGTQARRHLLQAGSAPGLLVQVWATASTVLSVIIIVLMSSCLLFRLQVMCAVIL